MNKESKLKRFTKNLISFLIILAVGTGAFFFYNASGPIGSGTGSSEYPSDLKLQSLKAIEGIGYASNEKYNKQFAFEIMETASEQTIAADILEIYSWGRSQYGDISSKCYTDPTSSCKVGRIAIFLLLPNTKTDKYEYDMYAVFRLDQDAIDMLLLSVDEGGSTLTGIDNFHKNLYQTDKVGFLKQPVPWLYDLPIN